MGNVIDPNDFVRRFGTDILRLWVVSSDFTKEVYQKVVSEATENNLKPPYHVYARLYLCQVDTVNFYQIPNSILLDFGFDLEKDKFN